MGDWGRNDWNTKEESNGWGGDSNGWGEKKEETSNGWGETKQQEESNGWGETKQESNGWGDSGGNGNDWEPAWQPPARKEALKVLGDDKEWTKEAYEAMEAKKVEDKNAFYDWQKYNQESMVVSKKTEFELSQDEEAIFGSRSGNNAGIDFDKYKDVPVEIKGNRSQEIPVVESFDELYKKFVNLPESVANNVRLCGYKTPTPVQKYAIPAALCGRDVMCCAQTGSGKTASFLIPIIGEMVRTHKNPIGDMDTPFYGECDPDTLILTPTRELCVQIYEEALKFTHRTSYRAVRIYGGEKPGEQMKEIAKGTDILVATPGRLIDFIDRGLIRLDRCCRLVLDEADRMLDFGFEPQVRHLIDNHGMPCSDKRQTMMFSATFSDDVQKLAKSYLYDYLWIGVGRVGGACDTVKQELLEVFPEEKPDKLIEILDYFLDTRDEGDVCICFVNSKASCTFLDEYLWDKKMDVAALHGDLTQPQRDEAMRKFRCSAVDCLLATDVASRGLDIESVRLVINYDMPTEMDSYIHRIGRTGRIGNHGKAISFIARSSSTEEPLENLAVLKELVNCLHYTKNDVPDWLQPLIDRGENPMKAWGATKWGGRDARDGQYGAGEERERSRPAVSAMDDGGNDWWGGAKAEDPWKKDDAPAEDSWKQGGAQDSWKKDEAEGQHKEAEAKGHEDQWGGGNNWDNDWQ